MELSFVKSILVKKLTDISKAAGRLCSVPILEGVYIEAGDDGVMLTCYNLEFGLTATIPAVVTQKGSAVVSASGLLKLAKTMTGDTLTISAKTEEKPSPEEGTAPYKYYLVELSNGSARFTVAGMDVESYPQMPEIGEAKEFSIPQRTLRSMTGQTLYAVAKSDARPVHMGALFDLADGLLKLVTVDGYRLALRREKVESSEQMSFVVPSLFLSNLVKLLNAKDESNARISASDKYVIFEFGEFKAFSRLLDGEFLKYNESIPGSSGKYIVSNVKELTSALDRAVQISRNASAKVPLRMLFCSDKVCLTLNTHSGEYYEEISCESHGIAQDMLMGFDVSYMMDALKSLDCDNVRMEFSSVYSPLKLVPTDGEECFVHLVLPVRLKDQQAA